MRNLILHQTHIQRLIGKEGVGLLCYCLDEFSKLVILLDTEMKISIYSYEDVFLNFTLKKIIDLEEIIGSNDKGLNVLGELMTMEGAIKFTLYKNEEDSLNLVFKSGLWLNINTESEKFKISQLFNENQSLDGDNPSIIIAGEISPNLENIAFVYSDYKLLLLNYDMECINSCNLDDGDMTDASCDEFRCDSAAISWRGDSQYFSVLYSINGGRKCLVRDTKLNVFKGPARADNKVVFSTAENPVNNMSNVVSWQPSGSLIAYFQNNTPNQNTNSNDFKAGVIFSEKNCLRHGEFWIDTSDIDTNTRLMARFIKWNMDLPLLLVNIVDEDYTVNIVKIYHRDNYDWSLKYSFRLGKNEKIFSVKFSDAISLRLFLVFTNGKMQTIEYRLDYQTSLSNNNFPQENGSISVLCGNQIKLTPLGVCNIPPPMSLANINIINRLPPFIYHWWKNYLFVLSLNKIDVIKMNTENKTYIKIDELDVNDLSPILIKSFIFFTDNNLGYFVINRLIEGVDNKDDLLIISYEIFEGDSIKFVKFNSMNIHKIARCAGLVNSTLSEKLYDENYFKTNNDKVIIPDTKNIPDTDDLFFGFSKGNENKKSNASETKKYFYVITQHGKERIFNKAYLENFDNDTTIELEETHIISNVDIIKSKTIIVFNNEEKIIYLTKNHRLFLDNKLLAMDVTSFEFTGHFLLFTQTSNSPYNTLHLIDLNTKDYLPLSSSEEALFTPNFNYKSFNMRTVERGAMIVTVSKVNLVLQMPRGNLETIYPRLLILNQIHDLVLFNRDYAQSFEIARKHKINPNFIYDVDPEGFFNNISSFVAQVEKADYINLFLNCLENSFSEEFIQLNPDLNSKEDYKKLYIVNKVNKVCDNIRCVLNAQFNKYITSILHTHIKKSPPDHLDALKLVQVLKIDEKNKLKIEEMINTGMIGNPSKTKGKHDHLSADKALEYLCWVVNAEILFDFSLKTYDFELVIMVAKHTQKDPKEYLPYLKKLQEMDPVLMKYQINMDLKYYSDALAELSKGGSRYFDKCLDMINKHTLYDQAISLFSGEDDLLRVVYEHYGNYLKKDKKSSQDAAWAYYKSRNLELALKSFVESGLVNECLTVLEEMHFEKIEKNIPYNAPNIFAILIEIIEVSAAAKKTSELEKVYLYIKENRQKLILMEQNESGNFNYIQLTYKLMDSLISTKNWKSAYLFYSTLKDDDTLSKLFIDGLNLGSSLILNELKKNSHIYEEKYTRLLKVQHLKRTQPHLFTVEFKDKMMEDNVSDSGSVVSGKSSRSKKSNASRLSNTSKMSKKSKQKLSKRNVKEGSPIEEEFLIIVLSELKYDDTFLDNVRELVRVMSFVNLIENANELKHNLENYILKINNNCSHILSVPQQDFINNHPEIKDLFPSLSINTRELTKSYFGTISG